MHYKIGSSLIKSENAAKSHRQKSAFVTDLILIEGRKSKVLDYGCGKLRYYSPLRDIAKRLYVHDSPVQIERIQKLHEEVTSVIQFVQSRKNMSILLEKDFKMHAGSFDFILCCNVLSAIPSHAIRKKCLLNIKDLLSDDGISLIVVQYRNFGFDEYKKRKGAKRLLDGHIYTIGNFSHFYGIIQPVKMKAMIKSCGLQIRDSVLKDGSIYLHVSR